MKKLYYLAFIAILAVGISSCKKTCVQCIAKYNDGKTAYTSQNVCEGKFNRDFFTRNFKKNFKDYETACYEVE